MSDPVVTFDHPSCQDARQVGGKALSLAAMTSHGLPVAPGFAVTAEAYREFLDHDGLRERLGQILGTTGAGSAPAAQVAAQAEEMMSAAPLPEATVAAVTAAYWRLCEDIGVPDVAVAVRSSATAEDSVGASFAGEFETWVDVRGVDAVLEHVRRCYAAVYSPRVLDYLAHQKIEPTDIEMAVVVQKTVRARAAGVMFTISPVSGDRSRVVIEAAYGLGLGVVGGEVTPDRYVVNKVTLETSEEVLGDKRIEYRRGDEPPTEVEQDRRSVMCLRPAEVQTLVGYGKQLERLHQAPQDIEFAVDEELPAESNIVLLQCRPETVWTHAERKPAFEPGAGVMAWVSGTLTGAAGAASSQPAPSSPEHPEHE